VNMQEIEPFPTNCEAKIQLDGMEIRLASPREAIESGLTLLSNDRKATRLVLSQSIIANAAHPGERTAAEQTTSLMRLRAASLDLEVNALSGGNQQKVASRNGSKSVPDSSWTSPRAVLTSPPKRKSINL
jgi:ABC-type sugar transport system ATPase subunit